MKTTKKELHDKTLTYHHGRVQFLCITSSVQADTRPSSLIHGEPDYFTFSINRHEEGDHHRSGSPPSIYKTIGVDVIQ